MHTNRQSLIWESDKQTYRQKVPLIELPIYRQKVPLVELPRQKVPLVELPTYRQKVPLIYYWSD